MLPPSAAAEVAPATVPDSLLSSAVLQAEVFDPYTDDAISNTLSLAGGADQLALNNLRNIYCLVALRAGTPDRLRAYQELDRRLENEESDICRRIRELVEAGFPDSEMCGLAAAAGLPEGMVSIWRDWVNLGYLWAGRVPPPRQPAEETRRDTLLSPRPLQRRRLAVPDRMD